MGPAAVSSRPGSGHGGIGGGWHEMFSLGVVSLLGSGAGGAGAGPGRSRAWR